MEDMSLMEILGLRKDSSTSEVRLPSVVWNGIDRLIFEIDRDLQTNLELRDMGS